MLIACLRGKGVALPTLHDEKKQIYSKRLLLDPGVRVEYWVRIDSAPCVLGHARSGLGSKREGGSLFCMICIPSPVLLGREIDHCTGQSLKKYCMGDVQILLHRLKKKSLNPHFSLEKPEGRATFGLEQVTMAAAPHTANSHDPAETLRHRRGRLAAHGGLYRLQRARRGTPDSFERALWHRATGQCLLRRRATPK